jgi:hypothetical protein
MTLPEMARGRPRQESGPHDTTSPTTTIPSSPDISRVLADSDEQDAHLALRLAAWREGWRIGYELGVQDGRQQEGAERDEAWNRAARAALAIADPRGPEARDSASRRVLAAEAGCRRDAAAHWRARWAELFARSRDERFVREAQATRLLKRSYEQTMALMLRATQRRAA